MAIAHRKYWFNRLEMVFTFEDLKVYQKELDFAVLVIDAIDELDAPRNHFKFIEQLEAGSSSVALNLAEGKDRY